MVMDQRKHLRGDRVNYGDHKYIYLPTNLLFQNFTKKAAVLRYRSNEGLPYKGAYFKHSVDQNLGILRVLRCGSVQGVYPFLQEKASTKPWGAFLS